MKLRWLMFLHRLKQKRERFYIWLSRKLPKELRMWVFTCVFADVMSGQLPNQTANGTSAMEVYGFVANQQF